MFVYTSMYPSVIKIDGHEISYSRLPHENIIFKEHEDYAKKHFSGQVKEIPGDAPSFERLCEQKATSRSKHLTVVK
jgi:hypothetical protein